MFVYPNGVKSSINKVVGILETLRHECPVSTPPGQRGCRFSKSMTMESVYHIHKAKKDVVKDIHRLDWLGVRWDDSLNG